MPQMEYHLCFPALHCTAGMNLLKDWLRAKVAPSQGQAFRFALAWSTIHHQHFVHASVKCYVFFHLKSARPPWPWHALNKSQTWAHLATPSISAQLLPHVSYTGKWRNSRFIQETGSCDAERNVERKCFSLQSKAEKLCCLVTSTCFLSLLECDKRGHKAIANKNLMHSEDQKWRKLWFCYKRLMD